MLSAAHLLFKFSFEDKFHLKQRNSNQPAFGAFLCTKMAVGSLAFAIFS